MLNIDHNMAENAQTMDKAIFPYLANDFVTGVGMKRYSRSVVIASVVQAVEMQRNWFGSLIIVHEMVAKSGSFYQFQCR